MGELLHTAPFFISNGVDGLKCEQTEIYFNWMEKMILFFEQKERWNGCKYRLDRTMFNRTVSMKEMLVAQFYWCTSRIFSRNFRKIFMHRKYFKWNMNGMPFYFHKRCTRKKLTSTETGSYMFFFSSFINIMKVFT